MIALNTGHYEAIDLSTWIASNPKNFLTNFSKPESLFDEFPHDRVFIASREGALKHLETQCIHTTSSVLPLRRAGVFGDRDERGGVPHPALESTRSGGRGLRGAGRARSTRVSPRQARRSLYTAVGRPCPRARWKSPSPPRSAPRGDGGRPGSGRRRPVPGRAPGRDRIVQGQPTLSGAARALARWKSFGQPGSSPPQALNSESATSKRHSR